MTNDAFLLEFMSTFRRVPDAQKTDFMSRYNARARNPVIIFGVSVFLGVFGIDRFLLGQIFLGIWKLITAGGFGVWVFIDWFLVAGTTRDKNIEIANEIADNS